MTRPSALVLDGNTVKLRLEAERIESRTPVHVDWVRVTFQRRNIPATGLGDMIPRITDAVTWELWKEFEARLKAVPDCDQSSAGQALELARQVADVMGPDFDVHPEPRKGHDFYRHRVSIERNGVEVGWIGFQASSDSPRQAAQARTIHCNLYGTACTFAAPGWNHRLAAVVDQYAGEITRVDLALDFFDGMAGGISRVVGDYHAGLMNVCGKRPTCKHLGDWSDFSEGGRSFYFGSKEAGKQTNVYEKGDQLYGVGQGSKWLRVELRYGNKLRVLPVAILRDPASHFAGASDWHAAALREADQAMVIPQPVPCTPRLPVETVRAECSRIVRWAAQTGGPILAQFFRYAPDSAFLDVVSTTKRPRRIARFSDAEVASAFRDLFTAVGAGPAYA